MDWQEGIEREQPSQVYALFSGGHDSVCATQIASEHPSFTGVIHCNTGISIPETLVYVRGLCKERGWRLHELRAPEGIYERLVLKGRVSQTTGKRIVGFPSGTASHSSFYWHLKQRQLRRFVQQVKQGPHDRIGLVTGIRTDESQRRMAAEMSKPVHRIGNYLWLNPVLAFTQRDKNVFMERYGLPRNEVSDCVHRSGDCVCGSLARREELKEIALFFPEVAQRIYDLERRVKAAGIDDHFWGMKSHVSADQMELPVGPMCVGCART